MPVHWPPHAMWLKISCPWSVSCQWTIWRLVEGMCLLRGSKCQFCHINGKNKTYAYLTTVAQSFYAMAHFISMKSKNEKKNPPKHYKMSYPYLTVFLWPKKSTVSLIFNVKPELALVNIKQVFEVVLMTSTHCSWPTALSLFLYICKSVLKGWLWLDCRILFSNHCIPATTTTIILEICTKH